jgi:hypothetical protein
MNTGWVTKTPPSNDVLTGGSFFIEINSDVHGFTTASAGSNSSTFPTSTPNNLLDERVHVIICPNDNLDSPDFIIVCRISHN